MKKISEIIAEIVKSQPFLEEAMTYWFLNLTAFAEYIRPTIERELEKDISVHAIKMAISRMDIPSTLRSKSSYTLSRISSRLGLCIITLPRSTKTIELVISIMQKKRKKDARFFTMIEGVHEIDIIYEFDDIEEINSSLPEALCLIRVSWLGLISIELGDTEISTPWIFYQVTKQFAFHGINIIQVLSTYHELGIIIDQRDMGKAMGVLIN